MQTSNKMANKNKLPVILFSQEQASHVEIRYLLVMLHIETNVVLNDITTTRYTQACTNQWHEKAYANGVILLAGYSSKNKSKKY